MPLRDHFRSPLNDVRSWDELHGMWPAVIVQHLIRTLPQGYFAAPGIHLGTSFEVDIGTFGSEIAEAEEERMQAAQSGSNGVGVAMMAPPKPSLTIQPRFPDRDEYEIRIYDERKNRRLVAAIELISPSNKDRSESRGAFVSKVATLLRQGVCVSLVDVVTTRQFNLYDELLALLDNSDAILGASRSTIYAATLRCRRDKRKLLLDAWYESLQLGAAMPSLPVWLDGEKSVDFDLEATYEATCKDLRIP